MTKRYFGGKGQPGVYHTIINEMPPHELYIEGFLGGGSIMRHKKPAKRNIGVELHLPALEQFENAYAPSIAALELIHCSAMDFIKMGNVAGKWGRETLIYLDPPYPMDTRSSNQRYAKELTENDHIILLSIIKKLKCNVMISTYPNQIYRHWLESWRLVEHTSVASNGEVRKENLYCNFEKPVYLHDDSFIGENNDKRMDISRRIARNKNKIMGWEPVQRARLIKDLLESIPKCEKEFMKKYLWDFNS